MDYQVIILVIVGIALIVGFFFAPPVGHEVVEKLFKSHSTINIQDCKDFKINKIHGSVKLVKESITTPISNRRCAAYAVWVYKHYINKRGGTWSPKNYDEHNTNLLVKDGNHYAFILKNEAALSFRVDEIFESGLLKGTSDKMKEYLRSLNIDSTGLLGLNKGLKCEEGVLAEHEEVAVCGTGKWHRTSDYKELSFLEKDGVSRIFVFYNTSKQPLYITDDFELI